MASKRKNDNKILMKNIEYLGERYCKIYLSKWKKKDLENNWWEASKFFFSHSFMRGRRDELSNEYLFFAVQSLESYFQISLKSLRGSFDELKKQESYLDKELISSFKTAKGIGRGNAIKHINFIQDIASENPIIELLVTQRETEIEWDETTYSKNISLGNDKDVMMVLDVLSFLTTDKTKNNIYSYLKAKSPPDAYAELIEISGIGDKIATFVIRDIALINKAKIKEEDYVYVFPVDTWVFQISQKLGFRGRDIKKVKECLINKCKESRIDILKFAAGLWFLGFHSLDILLKDYLGRIELIKDFRKYGSLEL